MAPSKSSISIVGIALIVIGALMIMHKFHVISLTFSEILWPIVMVFGLIGVGQGFAQNRRGKIFWGTVWFLYGLFFFLRSSEFVQVYGYMIVPATFLIVGIAFLMMFFNDLHEWVYLVPAALFGGIGVVVLLAETDYLSGWEVYDALHTYWPIALILIGVALILRRRDKHPPQQTVS